MKYIEKICAILCMLFAGISASVLVMSTKFSFFVYDDFAFGKIGDQEQSIADSFISSIQSAFGAWHTWSGDVSTMFLQFFLSPINHGIDRLHIVLAVEMVVFIVTMFFFFYVILQRYMQHTWIWIMMGVIALVFLNGRSYSQVFHYFVASSYEVSLSFLLLALSFFLIHHRTRKVVFFVLTIIFGLLAMTGSLLEAGAGCMFTLLLLLYWLKKRDLSRYDLILFAVFICGAILSAFAPGNFARHEAVEGGISVMRAILYTFRAYLIQLEWMLKDTAFVLLFLISLLCGVISGWRKKYETVNVFVFLVAILVPMAAIFPTVYGSGSPYLPERVLLNIDFFLIVGWTLFAISCGNRLSGIYNENTQRITSVFAIFFVLALCLMPCRIEDAETYTVAKAMENGEMKRYYNEVNEMLCKIENSPDRDVVVDRLPEPSEGILAFDISEDPNYFANVEVAGYYKKHSVRLKGNDE